MNHEILKQQQNAMFEISTVPVEIKKNFLVDCTIDKEQMAASIRVVSENLNCMINEIDILKVLYGNGVRVGVDYNRIEEILKKKFFNKDVVVARGYLPERGTDAMIVKKVPLPEVSMANVSHEDMAHMAGMGTPVELDQLIVEKIPASPGLPGFTVTGNMLPSPIGKDVSLKFGENVRISEDGLKIYADIPGSACIRDGVVCIPEKDFTEWMFEVVLRKENMEAALVVTPGVSPQPAIDKQFVEKLLSAKNVVHGIDPDAHMMIPPKVSMTTVIDIAKGTPPELGHNAEIVERYKTGADSGQVLFRVSKGDVIVEKKPAKTGKAGRNVLGVEFFAEPPQDVTLQGGVNTRLSECGCMLYAETDGYVSLVKDKYCVAVVKEIKTKEESFSSRLDFDGVLEISGDVENGHVLIASHHIIVHGDVTGSEIVAGGALVVEGNVSGRGQNRIQSTGSMYLESASGVNIRAGGDVFIKGKAEQCNIVTNGGVYNTGGQTHSISGGKIISVKGIETDEAGNASGESTSFETGIPLPVRARYETAVKELREVNTKSAIVSGELKKMLVAAKANKPTQEQYKKLKSLSLLNQVAIEKIRQQKGQMAKLLPDIMKMASQSRVLISATAHPGTMIKMGVHSMLLDKPQTGASYSMSIKDKSIIMQPVKNTLRKETTILFTDIVKYSTYTSKYGDNAANEMLTKHNQLLFPVVGEFRGKIIKTIGDSIMACFDSADDAVAATVKMQMLLDEHNRTEMGEHKIKVRTGMNTGKGIFEGNDVFGDVVNMASRVEGMADGDEILISSDTFYAMKNRQTYNLRSLGMKRLKGKEELVEIFEVIWKT